MPANSPNLKAILNNMGPKQKETAVTVVVFLILLLVAKKAYDIPMAKVAVLNQQIQNEDEKRLTLDRIVALNQRLKKYQEHSWENTDFDTVVERISSVGQSAGLKISTIMPMEKKNEKNIILTPFSVSCTGTFDQVLHFMRLLENEPKSFRFRDISLTPIGGQEQSNDVTLNVLVTGEALHFNK